MKDKWSVYSMWTGENEISVCVIRGVNASRLKKIEQNKKFIKWYMRDEYHKSV